MSGSVGFSASHRGISQLNSSLERDFEDEKEEEAKPSGSKKADVVIPDSALDPEIQVIPFPHTWSRTGIDILNRNFADSSSRPGKSLIRVIPHF